MAESFYQLQKQGIYKKVLHGGVGELPSFPDGAKVFVLFILKRLSYCK